MKICVAQTRPVKGDVESNIANHKKLISLAVSHGAGTIVFPELSLTGYEPGLSKELATTPSDSRFDEFQKISDNEHITIGVGMPIKTDAGILITMILFQPHQPTTTYSKQYLHSDEYPYFIHAEQQTDLIGDKNTIAKYQFLRIQRMHIKAELLFTLQAWPKQRMELKRR